MSILNPDLDDTQEPAKQEGSNGDPTIIFEEDEGPFFNPDAIMAEPYDKEVDDTGKTPEQILAECGVTMDELNATFPSDYQPLNRHPSKMTQEELIARIKQSQSRQRNKRADNPEKVAMPSDAEINRINSERPSGKVGFGSEGPTFSFDGFLELLERSKEDARRKQESALEQRIRNTIYNEMKKSLEDIVEAAELESLNAAAAKQLFLDKTKEQSKLQDVLKTVRKYAKKGQSEMRVHYLCQYDWTKLTELGFTITNLSAGGNLEYKISWYSREK